MLGGAWGCLMVTWGALGCSMKAKRREIEKESVRSLILIVFLLYK